MVSPTGTPRAEPIDSSLSDDVSSRLLNKDMNSSDSLLPASPVEAPAVLKGDPHLGQLRTTLFGFLIPNTDPQLSQFIFFMAYLSFNDLAIDDPGIEHIVTFPMPNAISRRITTGHFPYGATPSHSGGCLTFIRYPPPLVFNLFSTDFHKNSIFGVFDSAAARRFDTPIARRWGKWIIL